MIERTVTITYKSSVDGELLRAAQDELESTIEQWACDYAAACDDDTYEVEIEWTDTIHSGDKYCHNIDNGAIEYGHTHNLCNRDCPCYPECRIEQHKAMIKALEGSTDNTG